MRSPQTLRRVALLLLVVAVFVFVQAKYGVSTGQVRTFADGLGPWAAPGFVGGYALACLVPIPKAPFSVAGGALFGVVAGVPLVVLAAATGATLSFGIARLLGRSPVRGMETDRVRELDDRIASHGFVAVLVARLIPVVPFTTVNYLFGLTGLGFATYVATTVVGIVPGITMYVTVGSLGVTPVAWPFAVLGGAVILVTGLIGLHRRSRRSTAGREPVGPSRSKR